MKWIDLDEQPRIETREFGMSLGRYLGMQAVWAWDILVSLVEKGVGWLEGKLRALALIRSPGWLQQVEAGLVSFAIVLLLGIGVSDEARQVRRAEILSARAVVAEVGERVRSEQMNAGTNELQRMVTDPGWLLRDNQLRLAEGQWPDSWWWRRVGGQVGQEGADPEIVKVATVGQSESVEDAKTGGYGGVMASLEISSSTESGELREQETANWQEVAEKNTRNAKVYEDLNHPGQFATDVSMAPLNYEAELDSGRFTKEINMTPKKIENDELNGWHINQNDWHYILGQPGDKTEDGWVGFGGRQGQNWLKFRLEKMGYFNWETGELSQLGGEAKYDRNNLFNTVNKLNLATKGDEVVVGSRFEWNKLWEIPGGGEVGVSWRTNGDGLKEEVIVNQPAREWIANKMLYSPTSETHFGFVFELDIEDVAKLYQMGIEIDKEVEFDDKDSEGTELRDEAENLLAFLPIDKVYVRDNETGEIVAEKILVKRFFKQDGKHYLSIGAEVGELASLPAGELIFDPTVEQQIGAGANDGARYGTTSFSATENYISVGDYNDSIYNGFWRFTGVTISGTVTASYIQVFCNAQTGTTQLLKIYGVDEDNPAAPTTYTEYDNDPQTAAALDWDGAWNTGTWNNSPSLNTIFQELVDTYTISNEAVLVQIEDDGSDTYMRHAIRTYELRPGDAAKLHIEWQEEGQTSEATATGYSFQRKTWYDGTRFWRAYNSDPDIVFEYSTDAGSTWTRNDSATLPADSNDFSIEADESNAFIAYKYLNDIRTMEASSYPGTSFSWESTTTVYNDYSMSVTHLIDHETGDFSQYDLAITDDGDLSVTSGAALAGTSYGQSNYLDDNVTMYAQTSIVATSRLRYRFYFDPNSLTMANGDRFYFNRLFNPTYSGGVSMGFFRLYYTTAAGYNLMFYGRNDADANVWGQNVNITDAPHYIEVDMVRATNSSSSDGSYEGWVDGVSIGSKVTGIDNYNLMADGDYDLQMGYFANAVNVGTSGTFYQDELVINNDGTEIGAGPSIYQYPTITRDSSGKVWIGATHFSGANHLYKTIQSTSANDISTWETSTTLDTSTNSNKYGVVSPLASGDIYATFIDNAAIAGCRYDSDQAGGARWEDSSDNDCINGANQDSVGTGKSGLSSNLSVSSDDGNNLHLAYIDASDYVQYQKYSSSWSGATRLDTAATNTYVTVSVDTQPASDDVYVMSIRSSVVYYKKYTGSTTSWGSETDTGWTEGTSPTNLSSNYSGVGAIFSQWTNGSGSPYTVSWDDLTLNSAPATPSLDAPSDTTTGQLLSPALNTTTTDTDSDYLRYKIQLCENVGMTTNCQTFDQTSTQTGWSGQNTESSTAYTSGTQGTYTLQSPLTTNKTYYWRSYAIDPGGTNTWSSTQGTPYSFTTSVAPTVSSVSVNGGSAISLTEGTTTTVNWTGTVTDTDGNADIASAQGMLYRSGVTGAEACTPNDNNCYADASCALSGCTGNTCTATCSIEMEFFAEPTDGTSPYAVQYWRGWIEGTDDSAQTGEGWSAADTPDVESMAAMSITSSITYDPLLPGDDTGASNETTTITNTGNTALDVELSGDNFCTDYPTCSGYQIAVGYQEYDTSGFTYGLGTALTGSPVTVQIDLAKSTADPANSSTTLYWGMGVPSPKEAGSYSGANTATAVDGD